LTLVRYWVARGRPEGQAILGSYESYSHTIGGILHTAGIEGFLADAVQHVDDETIEWSAFIDAWHCRFKAQHVGAAELDKEILTPNPEMLATVLVGVTSERGRRIKLGQELRKRRDAVIACHRICISDGVDGHGCWKYWLQPRSSA
jgi:hypothetical protein